MRVIKVILLTLMMAFLLGGCATMQSGLAEPKIANYPANLPGGAMVKVLQSTNGAAVVGIKGVVDILRIEIYGRDIELASYYTREDGWIVFILPRGRWFNFIFLNPADGIYHYVYVTKEDATMPPAWMDESITTFQPEGWGAAMTAREFRIR